jgi:hypothetical protein
MRQDDDALQQPYPDATPMAERFGQAMGVVLPGVRELHRRVLADLDEKKLGIGWWAPHPGTSRRVLISDHLLACIDAVEKNLVEARLHLLELRRVDEQLDALIAHAVKHDSQGRPFVQTPPRVKPADDLPYALAPLHMAGFFRAVGSALDCLGSSIVGVLALPVSILKADLDRAIGALKKLSASSSEGGKLQMSFAADLTQQIAAAGPPGWLPWATDYRNMLVHRGRRLELSSLVPRGGNVLGPDERPIMLARAVRLLAQDPALSDVEMLLSMAGTAPVLTEDATTTLEGVMASAQTLCGTASTALLDVWLKRRDQPALLLQPKEQWRDGRSSESRGFAGYKPGMAPFKPDQMVTDDTFLRRLKSAALDDGARKKWDTFD